MVLNAKRTDSEFNGFPLDVTKLTQDYAKPFSHQVGGHTTLSVLPSGHLLKPCEQRELIFYREIPTPLRDLVPQCCTTMQSSSNDTCCTEHDESVSGTDLNGNEKSKHRSYLVMSDLTRGFRRPAVLDLKLGTRQHGDAATREKAEAQTLKCLTTTSATRGIRLCGMKYYAISGEPLVMDKYEGRKLNSLGLDDALGRFFDTAPWTVELVTNRVQRIQQVLRGLNGLRLFGSSLLIVIETSIGIEPAVEVRLVDFANATFTGFMKDSPYEGPDEGSLLGLESLKVILDDIYRERAQKGCQLY